MIEKLPQDHFLINEIVESFVEDWKAGYRNKSIE
jgi:hypothetical protein